MSLTSRYSFDWIASARTATLYSVRSSCIRFASEYRIPTARHLYQILPFMHRRNSPVSPCHASRNGYRIKSDNIPLRWDRFNLHFGISHLPPSLPDTWTTPRANDFNFLSNAILRISRTFFIRQLFFYFVFVLRKVDFQSHWPMKFVISVVYINLRTDLILSFFFINAYFFKG